MVVVGTTEMFELPMSHYNRLQNPLHESIALIRAKRGTIVVIEDEPETREYKDYDSLLPVTMTDILMLKSSSATIDGTTLTP